MRPTPSLIAVILAWGVGVPLIAADTTVLNEDFAAISEWKDLSRLLPWGGQAAGVSAFVLGPNNGRQAIGVTATAVANSSTTASSGLRTFSCIDYPFANPIDHNTTIVTITFDARWDTLTAGGESGHFMPLLLGSYTASQVTAGNVGQFTSPANPYGQPAYHVRLRPSATAPSLFQYGGGTNVRLKIHAGSPPWWLPGFLDAAGFDTATPPAAVAVPSGTGDPYPLGSWKATSAAIGSTAWRTYAYQVWLTRQELRVDGVLAGSMPLPLTGTAPAYQNFPTLRALRLFWRCDANVAEQAWIANLRVTTNKAPTAGGDSYLINMASASTTIASPTLLANDTDLDGDALTIQVLTPPTYGSVTVNADGTFTYTHTPGHFGGDTFQYRVFDGQQYSGIATVSLNADAPRIVPAHAASIAMAPVTNAAGVVQGVSQVTQMVWGPDGRLYVASNSAGVDSWAYDPANGFLSDRRDAASISGCGIAFHGSTMYVQSPGPYNGPLGILDTGRITRLRDQDGDGIWGESGETNVVIVDKLPNGEHTCEQLIVQGNTLYVAFGTSTGFGRDTPEGTKDDGGETSYGGSICWIKDLTQVPDTYNAAGLGSNGKQFQTVGTPFTDTSPGKLIVHSSGARNPFALGLDGDGALWFSNNQDRVRPDPSFADNVHDQFFRTFPKADYGYANDNWRDNPIATGAGYFLPGNAVHSHTFDNLSHDASHPNYGVLHDPDAPVGLGPNSSADGFAFVTSNHFPLTYHKRAFITRWNSGDNREDAPGTVNLKFGDVVSIDHATGETQLIADGFRNPLAAIEDAAGNLLIADWGGGRLYRMTPVAPITAAHPFTWASTIDGNWSDATGWDTGVVPHQWNSARYDVTIANGGAPVVTLDRDATIASLTLGDRLAADTGRALTLTGGYAQQATGELALSLGGPLAADQGRVLVGGAASLAGTLRVVLANGFSPVAGQQFTLMTWTSRNGTFADAVLPTLGGGLGWALSYEATSLVLTCDASNQAPTVSVAASAGVNAAGTAAALSVLGADDGGEAGLTYTWSATGPASVGFSANGSNGAKNATATFTAPGTYTVTATISDGTLGTSSATTATIGHVVTTVTVSPATATVNLNGTRTFSATARNQFGATLSPQPVVTWTVGGGGAISTAGLFTAGATAGGPHTVSSTAAGRTGTAQVTVANAAPTVATAAAASPATVTGTTTTLSALGADDGGQAALICTWATTGTPPAPVTYNRNASNAARSVTATFTKPGSYAFQVTIRDSGNLSVTSSVNVTVNQTLTATTVSPPGRSVQVGTSHPFSAVARDQFGVAMPTQPPSFTWTVSGGGTIGSTGLFTAGAAAGGPHTVTAATGGKSGTVKLTVVAVALPSPWLDIDIGGPGIPGSAFDSAPTWTLKGSGRDIWGTSDQFHYAYQPLTGNGTVIARVASIQNTDGWAKGGVMIRESLTAGSRHALVCVTPGLGVSFQRRTATNGNSEHSTVSGKVAPHWVRLVRAGNVFTASYSTNGTTWTALGGAVTIPMGSAVHVGLALTSHNNGTLGTATFDNVSIMPSGGG